ncbi:3-hydroxyacyl-CoA dehydrogenase family protein [Streptomyces canus]|uniref:3-hydroxyacyl-CoA dehydrogenase family protein n=1 Tax=Streptomyces canus TaxID=58343 RepID=UPI00048BFF9C|nr:3-hydroxyacyl-CoA dehydrogenase family protein [Streptomyces canus]
MPDMVAVLGAGVIGTSVAHACLQAGHRVTLIDRKDKDWSQVQAALRRHQRLMRFAQPDHTPVDLERLTLSEDLADAVGAGLVIENVTEEWAVKREVYDTLRILGVKEAYIAANTSAIPIARLGSVAPDESRVVGVHFMNPVSAIDMVEVVRGPATSDDTIQSVRAFLTAMGKKGVVVNDSPGFVINRILMEVVNQAAQLVHEGVAEPHQIDELFKGCLGHTMGPLRTADLIGIDTVVRTLDVLREALDDPMFEPSAHLLKKMRTGELGMKTGRGFYEYGKEF